MSWARRNKFGNWAHRPIHQWIGLHASKSSAGSLKYSSSSLTDGFSFLRYRAVKDFWGEPTIGSVWTDGLGELGPRAGWSAILRRQFWASSCFHEHFILSRPHDENFPWRHCEPVLIFFPNYRGCPCVGFVSWRSMIKTKPWLSLLHWNAIKMYSAYISWVVDGQPSVSTIPGLTSSLNKIRAQENEGTLKEIWKNKIYFKVGQQYG